MDKLHDWWWAKEAICWKTSAFVVIHLGFVVSLILMLCPFLACLLSWRKWWEKCFLPLFLSTVSPSLYRHPTMFSFSFAPKVFARERQSVLKCVNALQARTPASTRARGRDLSKTNSGFSSRSQRDLINESAREASTKSSLSRSSRDWVNKDAGPLIDHFD